MTRRGELLAQLARLLEVAAPVVTELAALEGTMGETPQPPLRPRRRPVRVAVVPSPPAEPMDEVAKMRAKKGAAAAVSILRSKGFDV